MFKKYAVSEDVTEKFAQFSVGETVTLLRDIENDSVFERECGVFEAGTVMRIRSINPCIAIPQIPIDELDDFTVDEDAFLYELELIGSTENVKISCPSECFVSGAVSSDDYKSLYKEKVAAKNRKMLVFICICATVIIPLEIITFIVLEKICNISADDAEGKMFCLFMTGAMLLIYLLIAFAFGVYCFTPQFRKKKKSKRKER